MRQAFKRFSNTTGLNRLARNIQEIRRDLLRYLDLYTDHFDLRDEIQFQVDKTARKPFAMFTKKDQDMIREMDLFIELSANRKCFLDIGSLYGIFSLAFCSVSPLGTAYAVEPSPKCQKVLERNIRLNAKFNIRNSTCAIGSEVGRLSMHHEWVHYIADHSSFPASRGVPMTTLDDFVKDKGIKPDLIKIDVDGYEGPVIKGALNYLGKNSPIIFLELHGEWIERYGYHPNDLMVMLTDCGYQFFDLQLNHIDDNQKAFSIFANRIICTKNPDDLKT